MDFMDLLNELQEVEDIEYDVCSDGIWIRIWDSVEFDDDWEPIPRDFEKPEKVQQLENLIINSPLDGKGYFAPYLVLNKYRVFLDYGSWDA